jgi:hypothetical protein
MPFPEKAQPRHGKSRRGRWDIPQHGKRLLGKKKPAVLLGRFALFHCFFSSSLDEEVNRWAAQDILDVLDTILGPQLFHPCVIVGKTRTVIADLLMQLMIYWLGKQNTRR